MVGESSEKVGRRGKQVWNDGGVVIGCEEVVCGRGSWRGPVWGVGIPSVSRMTPPALIATKRTVPSDWHSCQEDVKDDYSSLQLHEVYIVSIWGFGEGFFSFE